MACTAVSLLAAGTSAGIPKVDDRAIFLGIIGSLTPALGNPTATQTMAAAATYGFLAIDDKSLLGAIAAQLIASGGMSFSVALTTANTNKLIELQPRDQWNCILQIVSRNVDTIPAVVATAVSQGYDSLSDRELRIAIAQLVINNASTLRTRLTQASLGFLLLPDHASMGVLAQLFCNVFP